MKIETKRLILRPWKDDAVSVGQSNNEIKSMPYRSDVRCMESFLIMQKDKSIFPVIDYASAGTTWDNNSKMSAWFEEKL